MYAQTRTLMPLLARQHMVLCLQPALLTGDRQDLSRLKLRKTAVHSGANTALRRDKRVLGIW